LSSRNAEGNLSCSSIKKRGHGLLAQNIASNITPLIRRVG
jgi:hypothetical protein